MWHPLGAEYAIGVPMGLWYGNRVCAEAAGAPCCDNREFCRDTDSITNNPAPPLQHAQTLICTRVHTRSEAHVCSYGAHVVLCSPTILLIFTQ